MIFLVFRLNLLAGAVKSRPIKRAKKMKGKKQRDQITTRFGVGEYDLEVEEKKAT